MWSPVCCQNWYGLRQKAHNNKYPQIDRHTKQRPQGLICFRRAVTYVTLTLLPSTFSAYFFTYLLPGFQRLPFLLSKNSFMWGSQMLHWLKPTTLSSSALDSSAIEPPFSIPALRPNNYISAHNAEVNTMNLTRVFMCHLCDSQTVTATVEGLRITAESALKQKKIKIWAEKHF